MTCRTNASYEQNNTVDWIMRELMSLVSPSFPQWRSRCTNLQEHKPAGAPTCKSVTEVGCACLVWRLRGLVGEIDVSVNDYCRAFVLTCLS